MNRRSIICVLFVIVLSCFVWSQVQQGSSAPPQGQKGFDTPQQAAEALIKAAENYDVPALLEMFGPDGKDLVESADPVQSKNNVEEFAGKARQKRSVNVEKGTATILVGSDYWPVPVPLVKKQGKWYFDTKAGHDEILYRRIGANELDAIQLCRGYVEAQKAYAQEAHGNPPVHQYAQKIISTPGQKDGLFWRNEDGSPGGPISEAVARALEEGYSDKSDKPKPYHGYYFKILQGQGPNTPLGEINYNINGVMIGGFALVAVPAEYRVTGVKSFIVNQDGVVYEKDLGPDSLKIAKEMTQFNPDKTWRPAKDKRLMAVNQGILLLAASRRR
ncbi:MAG TPA: DUF2950 domain-containing protein [Candidatus Angelobacter sp.]|nr:DUF2950 domain-containing protein [Candidatus Angelobacter sp.]